MPQMDPEQAIEASQLELVQRRIDGADAGPLELHGDLPQLHALVAKRLEACQDLLGQRLHDMVERLLLGLGALLADGLGCLGVDVLLELRMRSQQAEVGDLGRRHQRQDNVRHG